MNSRQYSNLKEAYLSVYRLNEFLDGGSVGIKRTFGGAPGTKQNTTVFGSASKGNANVSGSLEKGTFSGQGDKISQGVDNAIKDYDDEVTKGKPNVTPRPTGTSTITKGVHGTLDANISGGIRSNDPRAAQVRDAKKAAVLKTAADNIANVKQQTAAAAAAAEQERGRPESPERPRPESPERPRPEGGRPDGGKSAAQQEAEERNNKYYQDRVALVKAGITDEGGNEYPGSKRHLEDRLGGQHGTIAADLLTKLRNVTDNNTAAQLRNAIGVRKTVEKSPGVYGVESFDLFDYMMEYLIDEGYANTNENALGIMANMSEDWRESIISEMP